jgi:lipopolysaccharide heptosyltransferase I
MPESFRNILIIKPSSLGDVVLALPALTALRTALPDARISWLIRPEFAPLLHGHPHLDEIIPFDRNRLARAWFNPAALADLLALIRLLRRRSFDAVFDLQGLFRSGVFAWLSRSKKRFGMANARECATIFYTDKITQTPDCVHLVDFFLKIVRAAGAKLSSPEFILPVDPDAAKTARGLLASHQITDSNYTVFVPGARRKYKCWPIDRFAELAEQIQNSLHLRIVAVGTSAEKHLIEQLKSLSTPPIANLAGRTSLAELVAVIKNAALVISNDTGPGHIAAALHKPLVMMFDRINPARLAPYKRDHCVAAVMPHDRGMEIKSSNPKYSIKTITVQQVFQKARQQTEHQPQPTSEPILPP